MPNNQPKVLVVDDEPGMRLTLEGIIEDEGYDVVGASDGYQAIEMARQTPFDLIFISMKMPGIDGVDTYREIKKLSPGSVVFMMTGFIAEELVKDALQEGAYAVIYKPFEVTQIIDIVRSVLKTNVVLVVDDRPNDRELLRSVLEDDGCEVCEAKDGPAAIALAAQRRFTVILMDIRMPGMDGFTAAEEIRNVDPLVKVIFITGYELDESARKALQAGAYTALNKPVDPQKILTLIKSVSAD